MLAWKACLCFVLLPIFLVRGSIDEAEPEDSSFTFSCAGSELLSYYNQSNTEYLLAQCTPAVVCGEAKACVLSRSPACPSQFQYIAGVEKHQNSMIFTCCQLSPQVQGQEACTETQVLDETFIGKELPPGAWKKISELATSKRDPNAPAIRHSRFVKRDTPVEVTLDTSLFLANIDSHHPAVQFLKSITKIGKGYSVRTCTITCSSTTSTLSTKTPSTVTQTQTQQPSTARDQPKQEQAKKGLFNHGPGAAGGHGCFSGDMTVVTPDGQKRMDELHVGEKVLVFTSESTETFQPIEWFYHRDPDHRMNYIDVETKSGYRLSLTANHLLPLVPCTYHVITPQDMDQLMFEATFASKAKVGACLAVKSKLGDHFVTDPIIRVSSDKKRGVFSPITSQGTIVVNGIQTSCYSSLENQAVQRSIHSILIRANRFMQSVWQMVKGGVTNMEMEDKNIPSTLGFLLEFAKKILPAHVYQ